MATSSPSSDPHICQKHNNRYTAYCQQHNASMCIDCLLEEHRECIKGTINVSNAEEAAMATTDQYFEKLDMLGAEFIYKMKEKKQTLAKLEGLDETLKAGIRSFRIQLIEKINTISGEAFELATSILTDQKFTVKTDIAKLDKLMSQLNELQKSIDHSLNTRLSSMMEELSSTHVNILHIENEYERIKNNNGKVNVQFLVNPMIHDFLETFNSLGEVRVENELSARESTCLYLSPTDIKRMSSPYRKSIIESGDNDSNVEVSADKVFVYQERPLTTPRDNYIRIDDVLITGNIKANTACRAPQPLPNNARDNGLESVQKAKSSNTATSDGTKRKDGLTVFGASLLTASTTCTLAPAADRYAYQTSMFYEPEQSTVEDSHSNMTRNTLTKVVDKEGNAADNVKLDTVTLRSKPIPHPRRLINVTHNADSSTKDSPITKRIQIPRIPKNKITTNFDASGDGHTDNAVLHRSLDINQTVPMRHLFTQCKPSTSGNTAVSDSVVSIDVRREMPGYQMTSSNSSRYNVLIQNSQDRHSDTVMYQHRNYRVNDVTTSSSSSDIRNPTRHETENSLLSPPPTDLPENSVSATSAKGERIQMIGDFAKQTPRYVPDSSCGNVVMRVRQVQQSVDGYEIDNGIKSEDTPRRQNSAPLQTTKLSTDDDKARIAINSNPVKIHTQQPDFPADVISGDVCLVTGMAITSKGDVIMCLCNQHKLQLYDSDGDLKDIYTIAKPYGACSVKGNKIAVTSRDRKSICIFIVVEDRLTCVQEENVCDTNDVYGVSYCNGFFCVSSLNKVLIMTETLKLYKTIKGTTSGRGLRLLRKQKKGRIVFSSVHYSAIEWTADALLIYLSDFRQERVICIDIDSQVKWTHLVSCPTSIQLHRDKVFVATKKRIVVLCAITGRFIRDIKEDVPKRPWALAVDTMTKGLLVSNRSKNVNKAKQVTHVPLHCKTEQSENDYVFSL